jgi:hypothetical protein
LTTGRSGASFFALDLGFAFVSAFDSAAVFVAAVRSAAFGLAGAFRAAGFFSVVFFAGALEVDAWDALLSGRVAVSRFGFAAGLRAREPPPALPDCFLAAGFLAGFF